MCTTLWYIEHSGLCITFSSFFFFIFFIILSIIFLVVASVTSDVLLGEEVNDSRRYFTGGTPTTWINAFYGYMYCIVRSRLTKEILLQLIEYYYRCSALWSPSFTIIRHILRILMQKIDQQMLNLRLQVHVLIVGNLKEEIKVLPFERQLRNAYEGIHYTPNIHAI